MANDKSLLLVLDLRRKEENKSLEIFAQAQQKIAYYKEQIAKIIEYRQSYIDEIEQKAASGFAASDYIAYQAFLEKLDNIIEKQQRDLQLLEQDALMKQRLYFDKQKRRKIIESLLEKHRLERIKQENIREQKLLDEFVVAQVHRKNNAH